VTSRSSGSIRGTYRIRILKQSEHGLARAKDKAPVREVAPSPVLAFVIPSKIRDTDGPATFKSKAEVVQLDQVVPSEIDDTRQSAANTG
jgi:hypothetical protein